MKVFVILGLIDYSPSTPLVAYYNKQKAEDRMQDLKKIAQEEKLHTYDDYEIEEIDIADS